MAGLAGGALLPWETPGWKKLFSSTPAKPGIPFEKTSAGMHKYGTGPDTSYVGPYTGKSPFSFPDVDKSALNEVVYGSGYNRTQQGLSNTKSSDAQLRYGDVGLPKITQADVDVYKGADVAYDKAQKKLTSPQKGTTVPLTAKNNPVGAVQAEAANVPTVAGSVDFNRPTGLASLGMSGQYTPMNTTDLSNWGNGMNTPINPSVVSDYSLFNNGRGKPITAADYGGLGSYGMYNGVGVNKDAYNAIQDSGVGGLDRTYNSYGEALSDITSGDGNALQGLSGVGSMAVNDLTSGTKSLWNGLGGAEGFYNLAGGLSTLGSIYTGLQENKRREGEYNARMNEINRQRQRDIDWQNNINKSGLGTYSAGVK